MQKPYETRQRFTYVHTGSLTTVYQSKMVYRSERVSSDASGQKNFLLSVVRCLKKGLAR